jgi:hypothetical protein
MASVQSILSIGAMTIFTLVSLLFNANYLQNSSVEIQDKVYLTAFSLADDLIEEIKQKAFDEKTVDFQAINVNQLTPSGSLGKDGSEAYPHFNDIDDYKGYQKFVDAPHAEGYVITSDVCYCDANGNNQLSQQFYKKVTVTVTSKYLPDPFYMCFIFSLHSKN